MKDITSVSLSGISIKINSDAYESLQNYLTELQSACDKEPESGAEIIEDIEARIAELLLSNKNYPASPISLEAVEEVIAQMGHVEDIPFDENAGEKGPNQPPKEPNTVSNVRRRIYRNADGAKLGGVINGIATFFKVDVVLLRILYLLFVGMAIFWWHSGLLIPLSIVGYFVLWIIIPAAKTPRQKLEMEGATITANSIRSNLRQELDKCGGKPIKNEKIASIATEMLYVIGRIVRFILYAILAVIAVCIALLVMATLFTGVAGTEMIYSAHSGTGIFSTDFIFSLTETSPKILVPLLSVCLAAPLILVLYSLINVLFTIKRNKIFTIIISSVWILSWLVGGFLFIKEIRRYSNKGSYNNQERVSSTAVKELYVLSKFSPDSPSIDGIDINDLEIKYKTSTDSIPLISVTKYARGYTSNDAQDNAQAISYRYQISGDTIYLPTTIFEHKLARGEYHAQEVVVTIFAPAATDVYLSKKLRNYLNDTDYALSQNGYLLLSSNYDAPEEMVDDTDTVQIVASESDNAKKVEIEASNEAKSFKIKADDKVITDALDAKKNAATPNNKSTTNSSKSGSKREVIDI